LDVRNGGVVQLHGLNTYGGATRVLTRYVSTAQDQAAGDSAGSANPLQFAQVAPTLEVNKLADGGQASSIGNSSSDAANLYLHGATLRYTGAGDSTDRLFTVGPGGGTIESSGTGALNFTNSGALAMHDTTDKMGSLDDLGTDEFAQGRVPNVLYDFTDTSDVVVGQSLNDPDAGTPGNFFGLNAGQPNRLQFYATQAGVPSALVTGVSDDGTELGMNINQPIFKFTRIVFGTVPRTLTLGGANGGANTLTPLIANSPGLETLPTDPVKPPGVVNVTKTGAGTWILAGNNTYTGTTTVSQGTLVINGTQTGGGTTTVAAGAVLGGGGQTSGNLVANGTVDPGQVGDLAGALAVNGNMSFNAGSTALFEIGGTGAAQFDQLNATGTLAAGGTLQVSLTGGFVPVAGNMFDIMDFTTATGAFALSLPALPSGRAWSTASLLTSGTLSVVAAAVPAGGVVPEPGSVVLTALAAGVLLRQRGGRRRR
jgi:fibronectin-binding autotransporter adhesin